MRWIWPVVLVLLLSPLASAHPVPKDNHDRTIVVHLTPNAVVVEYRLELDEFRAIQDFPRSESAGLRRPDDFRAAFARYFAEVIGNNLEVKLDGRDLPVACVRREYAVSDHLRCDFQFRAPWTLQAGKAHHFTFREPNYADESYSRLQLALDADEELTIRDTAAPDEALLARSPDDWKPGDSDRLRRISATVLPVPSLRFGWARMGLPPDVDPGRDGASRRLQGKVGRGKPAPSFRVGFPHPLPITEDAVGSEEHSHDGHPLIHLLFDTERGLLVLLVLAAAFGAAHALTPGHGKTMVAAYLVGQRGTVWHALVLGLTTTLTHTGGVIVLAVGMALWFRDSRPAAVQAVLGLVGGLLIAGLGLWLLMTRLLGQADHFHLPGADHHHEAAPAAAGWWQVVLLGVAGGIIPCWDAVSLLLWAVMAQRLWLGVPLLLAFSAGLAGVLVVLGIMVVRAGEAAHARFGGAERFEKVVRALPVFSALVITTIGLVFVFTSVRPTP